MTTANNTSTQTTFKLFVLLVLLVLSSGAFAQNTTSVVTSTASTEISVATTSTIVIITETSVASNTDFAVWFMGSGKSTDTKINASNFGKKQLINSGIITNSVLVRSFLKKVICQESGVA